MWNAQCRMPLPWTWTWNTPRRKISLKKHHFYEFARHHFAKAHIWRASGFEDLIAICRTRKCYGSHWRWSCSARGQPITRSEVGSKGTKKIGGSKQRSSAVWRLCMLTTSTDSRLAPHQSLFLWEVLMVARETATFYTQKTSHIINNLYKLWRPWPVPFEVKAAFYLHLVRHCLVTSLRHGRSDVVESALWIQMVLRELNSNSIESKSLIWSDIYCF